MYPSIINSVYFLFFLALAFIWSLSITFGRKYILARALLVIYTGIHLLIFYLYQFGFFQDVLQPLSLWSKWEKEREKWNKSIFCCLISITGLTGIISSNCTERDPYLEKDLVWTDYVNPCALLLLYFYFAFETNRTLFQRVKRIFSFSDEK
jgi:glucan phosphoethanolaminetransferase (alkaline phosphatase superfamily)